MFRDLGLATPGALLKLLTWFALAGEILFLLLSLWRRGRMFAWLWMLSMHLGILLVVDFADLTFGMVMIHLFTFDPDWLPAKTTASAPVILYDGVCAFCDRTVQTFLEVDMEGALRFAPLQGETARPIFARLGLPAADLESIILVEDLGSDAERIHQKSEAVLRALALLGGFWTVLSWLRVVPSPLRDAAYGFIARNRYRWFGKFDRCRLPEPQWALRFLP